MNLIALVIVGAAAGFLATRFMKLETNVLTTVSIGILGALFGGLVLRGAVDGHRLAGRVRWRGAGRNGVDLAVADLCA